MLCKVTEETIALVSYLVFACVLLAFTALTIAVPHKVPSNYSWEFSGGFAHGLMNNYCQLPGGVHQFFSYLLWPPSLIAAAETSASCQEVWTCLVNDFGSGRSALTGSGAWGSATAVLCLLPPLEARDTCSLYMYDALPYMGL